MIFHSKAYLLDFEMRLVIENALAKEWPFIFNPDTGVIKIFRDEWAEELVLQAERLVGEEKEKSLPWRVEYLPDEITVQSRLQ